MNRSLIGGFLVVALTSTAGVALASKTVIKAKGADATASFEVEEVQSCLGGSTAISTITVRVGMFESTTTTNGVPVAGLSSSVSVERVDRCNGAVSFGFGQFEGVGNLQMTALQTGRITGHFLLDDGTTLDANITLTGTDTTTLGGRTERSILGRVVVIERSLGMTRTANPSGTVRVNGQNIPSARWTALQGQLARNTGGEITIMKP